MIHCGWAAPINGVYSDAEHALVTLADPLSSSTFGLGGLQKPSGLSAWWITAEGVAGVKPEPTAPRELPTPWGYGRRRWRPNNITG